MPRRLIATIRLRVTSSTLGKPGQLHDSDIVHQPPVLEVVRVARDLNGKSVELPISYCKTTAYSYAAEVT